MQSRLSGRQIVKWALQVRYIRDMVVRIRALFVYTFLRLTFSIIVEFGPIWAGLRFIDISANTYPFGVRKSLLS